MDFVSFTTWYMALIPTVSHEQYSALMPPFRGSYSRDAPLEVFKYSEREEKRGGDRMLKREWSKYRDRGTAKISNPTS
jgi:hypothetical protein